MRSVIIDRHVIDNNVTDSCSHRPYQDHKDRITREPEQRRSQEARYQPSGRRRRQLNQAIAGVEPDKLRARAKHIAEDARHRSIYKPGGDQGCLR